MTLLDVFKRDAIVALLADPDSEFTEAEAIALVADPIKIPNADYSLDRLMAAVIMGEVGHLWAGGCPDFGYRATASPWGCVDPACVACRIQLAWFDRVMTHPIREVAP